MIKFKFWNLVLIVVTGALVGHSAHEGALGLAVITGLSAFLKGES